MQEKADRHYRALKQIVPNLKRAILLDYDSDDVAILPGSNNKVLNEWKRKNIDNYLLIPDVWRKAVSTSLNERQDSLFFEPYRSIIDEFFMNENLQLPPNSSWKNVNASIFKVLDGKKLLFENKDCLFEKIKGHAKNSLKINRTILAQNMDFEEIHIDINQFFDNLAYIVNE
jgi:hypothetical protein